MIADNLSLTPEGNVVVTDKFFGLRVFSPAGELLFQDRVFQPQTSIHAGVSIFRKNQVIQKNGKSYVLHHLNLMDEVQEVGTEFFQKRRNLLLTNLENRETKQILPFPNDSKFLSGKAFPYKDSRIQRQKKRGLKIRCISSRNYKFRKAFRNPTSAIRNSCFLSLVSCLLV